MTGVLDHHRWGCALAQAYKEASRRTSVQPSTELMMYALCMRLANSSPDVCLNAIQKCSGGERGIISASSTPVWSWEKTHVELWEGDVTDSCCAAAQLLPLLCPASLLAPRELRAGTWWHQLKEGAQGSSWGSALGLRQLWEQPSHAREMIESGCQTSVVEQELPPLMVLMS